MCICYAETGKWGVKYTYLYFILQSLFYRLLNVLYLNKCMYSFVTNSTQYICQCNLSVARFSLNSVTITSIKSSVHSMTYITTVHSQWIIWFPRTAQPSFLPCVSYISMNVHSGPAGYVYWFNSLISFKGNVCTTRWNHLAAQSFTPKLKAINYKM